MFRDARSDSTDVSTVRERQVGVVAFPTDRGLILRRGVSQLMQQGHERCQMSTDFSTPLLPYRITICGLSELAGHAACGITHVVSILDPAWPDPA